MPLFWNLRLGCKETISRSYDPISQLISELDIEESCPGERHFSYPFQKTFDSWGGLNFWSRSVLYRDEYVLLIPESFQINIAGENLIEDTGRKYMILLHDPNQSLILKINPIDLELNFLLHLVSPILSNESPLAVIQPNTRNIKITGSSGKIAMGLDYINTDELSDVQIEFADWPDLFWQDQAVVGDPGEIKFTQPLLITGSTKKIIINGEIIFKSLWESFPPEIKGAMIGGILGIGGILLGLMIERRSQRPRWTQINNDYTHRRAKKLLKKRGNYGT
jgi:hypothetical protein